MATVVAAKVADYDVVGGGSFRCVRRWQRKLWSYPSVVEGAAHESSSIGGNHARKLDLWTRSSTLEEASDLCVGGEVETTIILN